MNTYRIRIQCTIDLRKPRTQLLSEFCLQYDITAPVYWKTYYSTVLTHDRQWKQLPSLAHTLAAPAKPVVVMQNWLPMSCQCLTLLNCSLFYFIRICFNYWVTEMTLGGQSCNDCSACPGENVMVWQSGGATKPGRLQTRHHKQSTVNSQQ